MIKNSPTINVKPSASNEAVSNSVESEDRQNTKVRRLQCPPFSLLYRGKGKWVLSERGAQRESSSD